MKLIPLFVVLFSMAACSDKKEEVVKSEIEQYLFKKNAHLSYVSSEFSGTKKATVSEKPELALMGLSELAETPVKVRIKTSVDCQLIAMENVNPLKNSNISCEPVTDKTQKDMKYVKRTEMSFPPTRVMANAHIIKAGEDFEVHGSHLIVNTGKETKTGAMFRDASPSSK